MIGYRNVLGRAMLQRAVRRYYEPLLETMHGSWLAVSDIELWLDICIKPERQR